MGDVAGSNTEERHRINDKFHRALEKFKLARKFEGFFFKLTEQLDS